MQSAVSRRFRNLVARVKHVELFDGRGLEPGLKDSLNWIIYAVMFGQIWGFITTGAAWTGYLREVLHADDFTLGLISAVPVAANSLQLLAAYVMQRWRNRRFLLMFSGIASRLFWIPIALVPYLLPGAQGTQMMLVTCFIMMVAVGNSFLGLTFNSLMADIVPIRIRGRFFASRQAASLLTGLVGGLAASYLVDKMGTPGYTVALIVASVFGVCDILCYFKVDFPPLEAPESGKAPPFFSSLRDVLRDKNFMRVVFCFTCWAFAVNISVPFFNVHMLENLNMSYTQITLLNQIASNIIALLFVTRWGKPLDRYGGKAILQICSHICMLTPIIWMFATPNTLWVVLVANVFTGLFWPGIDLGQQNLYLGSLASRNRAMYVAVYCAVVNLMGVATSNALGGFLLKAVFTPLETNVLSTLNLGLTKYHMMFALTAVLRMVVVFVLFPRLREDGEMNYKQAAREIWTDVVRVGARWGLGVRASYLRKRYRRRQQPLPKDAGEGDAQ